MTRSAVTRAAISRAIVLGGGFAGVLVAGVLAGHATDGVVLVEGGSYPAGPVPRAGIPQGRHSHVLVGGGAQALETLLPGIGDELVAAGAQRRDLPGGALIRTADGWFHRRDTGSQLLSCTRWLLDDVVRARALAGSSVMVRERTRVVGLTGTADRVTGALLRGPDGAVERLDADLVVDATGRRSRAPRWLADLGVPPVEEETIDPGLAYATRVLAAPPGLTRDMPMIMIHPRPSGRRAGHGATLAPVEGERWVVTLTGTRGQAPPTDDDGFTACAHGLSTSLIAELMGAATPLGTVRPYLATVNRRRFFERGAAPAGFLAVGDALVAVNPVHSHGLTVAARQAARLDRELGDNTDALAAMADEAERSWRLATAQHRDTDTAASRLPRWVGERMRRALLCDPALMATFFRDQMLTDQMLTGRTPATGPAADEREARRALTREPAPPLSEAAAIAQYPQLSAWWGAPRAC